MMEEKINEMLVQIVKLPLLMQSIFRFENCVQTLSQTVALYDSRITNIEQFVSSLAARVTTLEANATTVSSGSGSASSWNLFGHSDGSTASGSLGSHGPGSSFDNRNTRRRLDTFSSPEDEHARSAVLLQFRANNTTLEFPCGSIAFGKSLTFQPTTNPSGFIAKQVAYPPDSFSRRELIVRTLWPDTRMMVSPTKLIVHFVKAEPISQSANPSHMKTGKFEYRHVWHGTFVLCFSYRTTTSFGSPLISKIRVCELHAWSEVWSLSQNGYGNGHFGSDGDPTPRGVVGFVFLQVCSVLQHAESSVFFVFLMYRAGCPACRQVSAS